MNTIFEGLRIAIQSIFLNKTRAALTMLGIVIGISAVIALISLGRGVEAFVVDQFQSLGANLLTITSSTPDSDTRKRIEPLTTADVEALSNREIAPHAQQVGARYDVIVTVSIDGESMRTTARGLTPNMPDIINWYTETGSFITAEHIERTDRVVILGRDVVDELYGDPDYNPIDQLVRLNGQTFSVIGVMEPRESAFGNDDSAVIVPLSTAQTRLADARKGGDLIVSQLLVQATSQETAPILVEEVDQYLFESHNIRTADEKDYNISDSTALLDSVGVITGTLTIFLGIIAGVSLLVGGIGIMNIMLVTVTERTREIGLRKAVGAQPTAILLQFLFESSLLSLIGGVIGIFIGWLITLVGTSAVPNLTLVMELDAVLLATVVSTVVGVGFGLLPARQAALMNPIDALRYE